MRPKAVRQAEIVYLVSIGLMLVGSVLQWRSIQAAFGVGVAAGVALFAFGLWALLLLFTTRRGRNWARWVLAILSGLAMASILYQAAIGLIPLGAIGALNVGQAVLAVIGAVLLFRPAANAWFAAPHADWAEDA